MDNDNKIKSGKETPDQRHKEVLLFLNEELSRLQTVNSTNSYDLEKEYAKTKKNRSFFSTGLLLGSLLAVFLIAWGITAGIEKQNSEITVNLEEFEGLNIKNLLDSVSKVQTNYDNAMKNRTNLVSDKEIALNKAAEKRDSDLFLIESLTLKEADAEQRRQKVLEEYEESIALVEEYYNPLIVLAENELAEYKKQLDEYDTAKLESARQQEQALDSERRVHQLEIDKISKDYEARINDLQTTMAEERRTNAEKIRASVSEVSQKYLAEIAELDPDLSGDKNQRVVGLYSGLPEQTYDFKTFVQQNNVEDETTVLGMGQYQEYYDQFNSVMAPLEKIPFKNSAPSYLNASKKLVQNMGVTFENAALRFSEEKKELDNQISDLNNQITKLKRDNEAEKAQLKASFVEEKAALAKDYTDIYEGILASAKAQAVVISAHSKDAIRIFVIESQRAHITEAGVGAEIKASKSVKGVIKPIAGEPGFYLFESALDKNGTPVDFDFDLVAAGQLVKVSAK